MTARQLTCVHSHTFAANLFSTQNLSSNYDSMLTAMLFNSSNGNETMDQMAMYNVKGVTGSE